MGLEETVVGIGSKKDNACQMWTLCPHAFYDLTHVSPAVFLFLLKECYYYGMVAFSLQCYLSAKGYDDDFYMFAEMAQLTFLISYFSHSLRQTD